jgi:hypothetical protein
MRDDGGVVSSGAVVKPSRAQRFIRRVMRAAVGRELPAKLADVVGVKAIEVAFRLTSTSQRPFGKARGRSDLVEQLADGIARCCSRYGGSGHVYRFVRSGTSAATLGQRVAVLRALQDGAVPTFAARSSCRYDITRRARARHAKSSSPWLDSWSGRTSKQGATACCGDTSLIVNWRRTSQIARGMETSGSVRGVLRYPRALGHQHHQPTHCEHTCWRRTRARDDATEQTALEQQCVCACCPAVLSCGRARQAAPGDLSRCGRLGGW